MLTCKICHATGEFDSYQVKEMMFGYRDSFTYFQCAQCACLQLVEIPPDLQRYYPENYYSFRKQPAEHFRNPVVNAFRRIRDSYAVLDKGLLGRILHTRFPNLTLRPLARIELNSGTRILDVGCGKGWELFCLKNAGFDNLLGVDPFIENTIEYENGLTILKTSVCEVSGEYDVIMFHHSFEHIPNPLETLQHTSALLAHHGVCLIRIPTVSSFAWEHYRSHWIQLDAPRHFYVHSVGSMNVLASQSGLTVEDIVYDSTEQQFWGSEQYVRDIPLVSDRSYLVRPDSSIFSRSEMRSFALKAAALNRIQRGDQASFYLRKV